LLGGAKFPLYSVRAQYRREDFDHLPPPPRGPVFRLLFCGRLEREKGALDLVRIAALLHRAQPDRFSLEVAGDGSAVGEMRSVIANAGLNDQVHLLGHLDRHGLLAALGRCDAVLVPTTSAWVEGLNKVVIEGILAGRPVVTSCLTNAGDDVAPALLLAKPDDPADYAAAITRLASQPDLYASRRQACDSVRSMFFDRRFGFGAAIASIARSCMPATALAVTPAANITAAKPPPPTAVDHKAAVKRRIAIVQHGDLAAARSLLASGQSETYFGMKYSVQCIEDLVSDCEHLIISLDARPSDLRVGRGRLIGMPIPPSRRYVPNIMGYLAWARRVGRTVARFDPTHVLIRTGMSPVVCEVLRHTVRNRVSSLVIKANLVEAPRRPGSAAWIYFRRMVRLLNDPSVFLVGNHKFPASASVIDAGVHAEKVVAWDWPGIRHPRDHAPKPPPPAGRCRMVYVGVMSMIKGAGDVIDGAAELQRRGLDVSLTMMGNGPDLPQLRQRAADSLGSAAMVMGPVANAAAFAAMLDSDLVVVPSRKEFAEGMPLTLTEALASRTPVIASDHPVIAGAFRDGEGVRIFRAADPQSMADAAQSTLADPEGYARLSHTTLDAFGRVECHTLFGELLNHWWARTSGQPDRTP
jgi:glycosyltransferase involved in cell wall biosynthesis